MDGRCIFLDYLLLRGRQVYFLIATDHPSKLQSQSWSKLRFLRLSKVHSLVLGQCSFDSGIEGPFVVPGLENDFGFVPALGETRPATNGGSRGGVFFKLELHRMKSADLILFSEENISATDCARSEHASTLLDFAGFDHFAYSRQISHVFGPYFLKVQWLHEFRFELFSFKEGAEH